MKIRVLSQIDASYTGVIGMWKGVDFVQFAEDDGFYAWEVKFKSGKLPDYDLPQMPETMGWEKRRGADGDFFLLFAG